MQLEDLREGRYRHVGDPANGLPLVAFRITNRVGALVVQGIRGTSTAQLASSTPSSVLNSAMHGVASERIMSRSKPGNASSRILKRAKAM